jgi:hypothetical protein
MNCAGSVALIGDESSTTNSAAMLGTAAHKVIEVMGNNGETDARKYHGWTAIVHEPGTEETILVNAFNPTELQPGWHAFPVDSKMVEGVQMFIDEVERSKEEMFKPEEFNERFINMSWLDDRLGGTADKTLVEPFGLAKLLDYKNGYNVVEVKDNEQLKNYAVGILHEHPDAEEVEVTIVQPNAPHEDGYIRSEKYTCDELKLFEIKMKEAADATSKPNAPLRVGDWCKWCPAKTRCKEFDRVAYDETLAEFGIDPPPGPLLIPTDGDLADDGEGYRAELSRKARWIPLIDQWAREIERDVQAQLMEGKIVPGFKLVEGRTKRKWSVTGTELERRVAGELGSPLFKKIKDFLWVEPKPVSPAKVEKIGDKATRKLLKALVSELAITPPGKITVADESDPRAAIDLALIAGADFADDPIEGEDIEHE